ncbi:MAG TPA: ABC transporter ATP-binding protein/permease [Metalysinibacillus jejuensis]|uniref:ABC transporter ATP-binding protein/permease n=1 Tax=Metalysinibacillus jejuensis TaxID=914327 RepID=A0A921N9T1_9BACL|nr:ABC transporter ATP-binding protein/permease [Metalysinibacillus jejuensis]
MFEVLGKLSWFYKISWKKYTVAVLLLCVANLLGILPPLLVGKTVDAIHQGVLTPAFLQRQIIFLASAIIVMYVVSFIWQYQLFSGANSLEKQYRSRLMKKFLNMSPSFYEKNRTGDLMARATNDLSAVAATAGFGILTLADSTLYLITIIITMGVMVSWKLTLLAVLPLPILALAMKILGKKIHERYMLAQTAFGEMNDGVLEAVEGVRVVRAYVQERDMEEKFAQMTEDVYQKNIQVKRIEALFNPLTKIVTTLSYMIGLGYGAVLVSRGEMTVGGLVMFNVYLGMIVWPMFAIGELINVMQMGNASLDRVEETLQTTEAVVDPLEHIITREPNDIHFKGLAFTYPQSETMNLQNINVRIKRGETLGIVGKTGSGKTTFIKQLLREYPKGDGELALGEHAIEAHSKAQVRQLIGYVPQTHTLFSRSVRENILFGKPDATEQQLQEAIRLADFDKDLARLPEGIHTIVGEKGVALSGGQKQRISIARALIREPEILLLDDSLSAVDAKTEARIIANIRQVRSQKTTIIVTHRLSAIQHADQIIVLEDGHIIEQGTHEQLLTLGGWYKEQYDRQQLEEVTS